MNETIFLVAAGIAMLLAGFGLGYWMSQLRAGKQAAKAEDVQKQFDAYRQNVMQHFGRTAEHFQAIGQQYRELYDHMASGADALLDPQAMDEKLSFKTAARIESAAEEAPPAPQDYADGGDSVDDEPPRAEADGDAKAAEVADDAGEESAPREKPVKDAQPEAKPDAGDEDARRIYH